MIEVYRDSFTQHDVEEMFKFYRSPTGQTVVAKLPAVMQQMSQYSQQRPKDMIPKIQQLQRDTAAQMKAACDARPANDSPANAAPTPGALGRLPPLRTRHRQPAAHSAQLPAPPGLGTCGARLDRLGARSS
jgi:Uncharacterized protein conserved in bacteria (DUF2059)